MRNPGRSACEIGRVEPSSAAWCAMPRRAAEVRIGTACCSVAILPLVGVLRRAKPGSASEDGLVHETFDPHRRVVSRGRQVNPVSHCPGNHEGEQTLPTREPPSCVVRAKGLACRWKTKSLKQATNLRYAQRYKSNKQKGYVLVRYDAMCKVTLGVIPVSLLRFAYDAGSRCNSLVWLCRDRDNSFIPFLHEGN